MNATLYMANGPPWISRMSGYFFAASKSGGFTTQPCTFALPLEVKSISSVFARCLPVNKPALTLVSLVISPGRRRL